MFDFKRPARYNVDVGKNKGGGKKMYKIKSRLSDWFEVDREMAEHYAQTMFSQARGFKPERIEYVKGHVQGVDLEKLFEHVWYDAEIVNKLKLERQKRKEGNKMKKTEELKKVMKRLKGTSHRVPLKKVYDHDDLMVMEWMKVYYDEELDQEYLDSALCEIVFSETEISYTVGVKNSHENIENIENQPPIGYDDIEKAYDDESYAENILSMIRDLNL